MSYNVSLSSGGAASTSQQTGASLGRQADVVAEIVRAIKKEIHIPLFVKLTPEGGEVAQVAAALYAAGADAVLLIAATLGVNDGQPPGPAAHRPGRSRPGGLPFAGRDQYELLLRIMAETAGAARRL